jgi:hypothetical protein
MLMQLTVHHDRCKVTDLALCHSLGNGYIVLISNFVLQFKHFILGLSYNESQGVQFLREHFA